MAAVALLRVSTDEQGKSGLGIEAQMSRIEEFCSRKGFPLLCAFREHVSGSAPIEKRGGLTSALEAAKEAEAFLVVSSRDRLSRDPLTSMVVERQVKVLCADGTAEGDDPSAIFQRRILDAVAELERRMIAARTKAALEAKKRRGEPMGRAPYGFRYEQGELVEIPAQMRILNRILEASESGQSVREIARMLNKGGWTTPKGGQWYPTQVHRIVRRASALLA